jgi:hypothetical protein
VSAPVSPGLLTAALVAACVLLFAISLWSAWVLAGRRSALGFAALALALGWFAEQMGSSQGWFFGRYHYTTVLGPELGNVPVAIALMWFALCWLGYAMASLILWRQPGAAAPAGTAARLLTAWLAAMIVTAFDLGADPYFVFVLKAWIMQKTDGGWFGETCRVLWAGWWCRLSLSCCSSCFGRAGHGGSGPRRQRGLRWLPWASTRRAWCSSCCSATHRNPRRGLLRDGHPRSLVALAWWQWAPEAASPA